MGAQATALDPVADLATGLQVTAGTRESQNARGALPGTG